MRYVPSPVSATDLPHMPPANELGIDGPPFMHNAGSTLSSLDKKYRDALVLQTSEPNCCWVCCLPALFLCGIARLDLAFCIPDSATHQICALILLFYCACYIATSSDRCGANLGSGCPIVAHQHVCLNQTD